MNVHTRLLLILLLLLLEFNNSNFLFQIIRNSKQDDWLINFCPPKLDCAFWKGNHQQ